MTKVDGDWKVAAQWKNLNYPEELLDSLRSSANAALKNESFESIRLANQNERLYVTLSVKKAPIINERY